MGWGWGEIHGCNCTGSGEDVQSGGGEEAGRGEITDATAQGAGTRAQLRAGAGLTGRDRVRV